MDSKWLWFAAIVAVAWWLLQMTSFLEVVLLTVVILVGASLILGAGFVVTRLAPLRAGALTRKVKK